MNGSVVKDHLISFIRQRLSEHDMLLTDDTLEYTAERYAWLALENPKLSVSELLDYDIAKLKRILQEVGNTNKAV